MFDTNNNQMTGDILTANDPWRVCASLPTQWNGKQGLSGTLERPFRDGKATFDDLALSNKERAANLIFIYVRL